MIENFRNGSYILDELVLINYRDAETDIAHLFNGLDITEDMFSPFCYGTLTISDANDLRQNFPLIGQEKIRIRYKTHPEQEFKTRNFHVYSMTDSDEVNQSTVNYSLNFCSVELLLNKSTMVSMGFGDMTTSEIVRDVLVNSLGTSKPVFTSESVTRYRYVAPNIRPYDIVSLMKDRSVSPSGSPYFFFFETSEGLHFKSLGDVLDQEPEKYQMVNSAVVSENTGDKFKSVDAISFGRTFNSIDAMDSGMTGSKTYHIDLFTRKKTEIVFDYFNKSDYSRLSKVGSSGFASKLVNSTFDFPGSSVKHVKSFDSSSDNVENLGTRSSQMGLLGFSIVANADIPGNSDMAAGKILELDIPSRSVDDNAKTALDKYLTGRFLITSCRHEFTKKSYVCHIELVKDSYNDSHDEFYEERISKVNAK